MDHNVVSVLPGIIQIILWWAVQITAAKLPV